MKRILIVINKLVTMILLPALLLLSATTVLAVKADTLNIYFAGDLMQHEAQIKSAKMPDGNYDYSGCFSFVKKEIKEADIAVGNLEVTLGGKPYRGYPAFSAPDEYFYAIRDAGFDVLMTANNHCLDRGKKGLERTVSMLDSLKIKRAGTYINKEDRLHNYPLLVEKKDFKVVFLNATYGTNGISVSQPNIVNFIDREQIKKDILKARLMRPDVIIAIMHWGLEYKTKPSKSEMDLTKWLISMGVDHVIGSHPHVVQPVEVFGKKNSPKKNFVVYSLGNYISNMSARQTDGGMAVKLTLKKSNGITRLIDYKYSFVWTSRPTLNNRNKFILYPQDVDSGLLNGIEKEHMKRYLKEAKSITSSLGY